MLSGVHTSQKPQRFSSFFPFPVSIASSAPLHSACHRISLRFDSASQISPRHFPLFSLVLCWRFNHFRIARLTELAMHETSTYSRIHG